MEITSKLYTRMEAASYLRISTRTLDNEARAGNIKRVKLGNKVKSRVLYRLDDLEAYIERNTS